MTGMDKKVCAFTSVCEEDIVKYGEQYLWEIQRLHLPFAVHFDRCSSDQSGRLMSHGNCVSWSEKDDGEFEEWDKQEIFDHVAGLGYEWAMAWDVDETYEYHLPEKLSGVLEFAKNYDLVTFKWLNLWDDKDHIRVDGPFHGSNRVKLYNLQGGRRYVFDSPITNGAKIVGRPERVYRSDLACLHWGMMTREDRLAKKERWDRIYSTALKGDKNPYGIWDYAVDEVNHPPRVERHGYFS